MAKYKLQKDMDGIVTHVSCEVPPFTKHIPFNTENTDYQEYLEWVAAGNTADAAD